MENGDVFDVASLVHGCLGLLREDQRGNSGDDFSPTFTGGDIGADNVLTFGETWTYTASRIAILGQYENIATVSAFPIAGGFEQVTDSDAGHYLGVAPVPEPGSIVMLGVALAGLALRFRRRVARGHMP